MQYGNEWHTYTLVVVDDTAMLKAGFHLAMRERGFNELTVFRIRGPNGITKSPSTLFIFGYFAVNTF